jgi:hypothetical protein
MYSDISSRKMWKSELKMNQSRISMVSTWLNLETFLHRLPTLRDGKVLQILSMTTFGSGDNRQQFQTIFCVINCVDDLS